MKRKIITITAVVVLIATAVALTAVICRRQADEWENVRAAELDALRGQLDLYEEARQSRAEAFADMIRRVDYKNETVYVVGHITPDSDTVCSAIGMAYLLNSLGIAAEARIPGEPNLETEYVFGELDYPLPSVLGDASGKQLWLVDHTADTQTVNGAGAARIVGITDHHGISDVDISEPICVLSCPAGSTCTIVVALCEDCGVTLPKDVAGILLAGVLSDTSNMKSKSVTKTDESAFAKLKALSGITDTDGLFNGMLEAKLSFKGMSDTEIFYSDYKNYEHNGVRYGVGCIKVANPDLVPAMAARMQAVIASEIGGCDADLILYNVYDPDYSVGYMGFAGKDATFAGGLVAGTFGEKATVQGDFFILRPSLNRKTEIVPPIDAYLDTLPK